VINILQATLIAPYRIQLDFSDGKTGVWNAETSAIPAHLNLPFKSMS
jgi:hypothetical protein